MSYNDTRNNSSCRGSVRAQSGVVRTVDNLHTEVATVPQDVGLTAGVTVEPKLGSDGSHRRLWYKTPSVWWLLPITVVFTMLHASTSAPRTELLIKFACDELRPEYSTDANIVRQGSALRGTGVDVPVTFVQSNPILGDRVIRPMVLHPDKRCSQDPAVHRAVAKLFAWMAAAQGILSCLTLGWWTQYSDRAGRTKVLGITAIGALLTDLLLILVAFKGEILPGGYRILILGGVVHGAVGGFSACVAAGHAYIADCSSPLARSRIFSIWAGSIYAGKAIGLSLGSLITYYSNDLLSTFYLSAATHITYVIFMFFIVPESVSNEARARAHELYEADMKLNSQTTFGFLQRLKSLVRPLGVFIPKRHPSRKSRDWSLALVGAAVAIDAINTGSHEFRNQYAFKTFHWSSVQVGYWLSVFGFWRALYLSVILPLVLKALYTREERLPGGTQNDDEKEAQVKKVDLLVVRASLLIELVGYMLVGIVVGQVPFVGATIILSFGGGFEPSSQSLALALASPSAHIARREAREHGATISSNAKQEIGRLFGALGLIHSLGAKVVGPAFFSTVFGATVGVYPRAFFWVSAFMIVSAIGALGGVRLDTETTSDPEREPLLA